MQEQIQHYMNSQTPRDHAQAGLDDELNNLEEAHCIAETVVVPGLLGYIPIGKDNPLCIKKSPRDPDLLAVGGLDDSIYFVEARGSAGDFDVPMALLATFEGVHSDSVTSLVFSHDGKYLFSAGMDGVVNCFNVDEQRLISYMEGPASIEWMELHRKGNVLLVGAEDGNSWIFDFSKDPKKPETFAIFTGHTGPVTCGGFSINAKRVITGSQDSTIRMYDPLTRDCLSKVQLPSPVTCLKITKSMTQGAATQHNNKTTVILVGCDNGSLHVVSCTDKVLMLVSSNSTHNGSIEFIHVCADRYVIIGGTDGLISLLDGAMNFAVRFTHQAEAACTQALITTSAGETGRDTLAYVGFSNGTWGLFNLLSGEHLLMVDCFPADLCVKSDENRPILAMELLRHDKIVVSGDKSLSVWSGNRSVYVDQENEISTHDDGSDSESSGELGDRALGRLGKL